MDTCVSRRIDVWKAERREERSIICDAQGHTYPLSCSYKATAITCATLCINQRAFTMLTQYECFERNLEFCCYVVSRI
jgi:hypothetical protein